MTINRLFVLAWLLVATAIAVFSARELLRIGPLEGRAAVTTIGAIAFATAMLVSGWKAHRGSRLATQIAVVLSALALLYCLLFTLAIGQHFGHLWFSVGIGGIAFFAFAVAYMVRGLRKRGVDSLT